MKQVLVTTSWDDGHVLDVRLSALLKKYGIKGTFYISPKDHEIAPENRLSDKQIHELAKDFEIGAHTMTHPRLTRVSDSRAKNEIDESKLYLEQVSGKKITSFCYPCGVYKPKHVKMLQKSGFTYGRTIQRHFFSTGSSLEAHTTLHTYNHWLDLWKIASFANFNLIKTIKYFQWDNLAKAMFDRTLENGGVFHLWGHSWEIEKHGDWEKLENILTYIAHKQNVNYVSNSEVSTQERKKVLIAIPYFPPHLGGTQIYAYNIAKRLQNDFNWEVCIVTSDARGFKTVKENYEGFTVYRLGYWFKISNTPVNPLWLFTLRRIIKEGNISIINAHAPVPFLSDAVSLVSKNLPLILTYHGGTMKKNKILPDILIWTYEHSFFLLLLKRANFIICSSDYVRLDFLYKYLYKSVTITPAVDLKLFYPDFQRKNEQTILFVASLTRSEQHKGLRILINAFNMLQKDMPDARLIVVGDGDMKTEYENYVQNLGLQKKVIFRGRLFGKELAVAYQQTDIFVLPSLAPSESFGMVIIEAMATGKAVIGTMAGGIPRVIDHEKNGLLVESGNPVALSTAIKRLFDDPDFMKKLGEAGREKAKTHYDWDVQTTRYNETLRNFLVKKPDIVQLVGYYPPHIGGMEVVAKEISQELANRQYPLTVITSDIGAKNVVGDQSGCRVKRIHSIEIAHTPLMWSLPFQLLFQPRGTIIHVHIAQAGIPEIALLIAKLKNLPLVAHFHLDVNATGTFGMLLPFYKRYFLGPVLRRANKVIVFSKEQAATVQKIYAVKETSIVIIPNGVGKEFFYREPRQLPKNKLHLLYIGRLNGQKRVDRLIDAVALLKIPYQLTIVGDGEDRNQLEAQTRRLGLTDVTFEGKKYGDELRTYQRQADVFVLPSDIEGMPLVVLEAMAAGLPILGSNVLGIRELVKDTGILVKHPSPETFAKAITGLWNNREQLTELSKKGLRKAEQYTWTKLVDRLEEVYKEISQ